MKDSELALAYGLMEFLYNFAGATRKDLSVAFGATARSSAVTSALKELEQSGALRSKTVGKKEFYVLTSTGRTLLEKQVPYYRENRELFRSSRTSEITELTGIREAAAMCMRCSDLKVRRMGGGESRIYRRGKPGLGTLLQAMVWGADCRAQNYEKGYLSSLRAEEVDALLKDGVFYSSKEVKRYFADSGRENSSNVGAEAMYSSRITGVLLKEKGFTVFYRSAGPIPRFRYEVEKRFLTNLTRGRLDCYPPYAAHAGRWGLRPDAVMISRSYELIPALIMGYSRGRVKHPESMDGSERAQSNRRYYENRLFNPGCGLYESVYCVPYGGKNAEDLYYILRNSKASINRDGEEWLRHRYGFCPAPFHTAHIDGLCCGQDPLTERDLIYSPVIDLCKYRTYVREYALAIHYPGFSVATTPRFAELLSHAVGTKIARFIDLETGETISVTSYDRYGYPLDRADRYTEASHRRWNSPDRPYALSQGHFLLPSGALEELKTVADRNGCSVCRLASQILAAVLDSTRWSELYPEATDKESAYVEQLLEQDRKTGCHTGCADLLIRCAGLTAPHPREAEND